MEGVVISDTPEQSDRIGLANVEDIIGEIASILYTYFRDDLFSILFKDDVTKHYSIDVNIKHLGEINQQITKYTCENPTLLLPLYDTALAHAQKHALTTAPPGIAGRLTLKPYAHVRIYFGPPFPPNETTIHRVPRSDEVGVWRVLKGTVVRTGPVKMLEWAKIFQCTKCGGRWEVTSDREQYNAVPKPKRCAADDGGMKEECPGGKIIEIDVGSGARPDVCKDYQEIKVQEPVEKVGLGTIPRSIIVILEDDLVDSCKAGDEIYVTGTVIRRYKPFRADERCEVEIAMVANHVRAVNEQKAANGPLDDNLTQEFEAFWDHWRQQGKVLTGRDILLKSFCPKIFGMYVVKLAIMLVLIGGVEMNQGGMKIRGDCHILLVGDPGTGKSQFLRYASKVSPRSILTTGIGSTNAGLTCAAIKDSGEWQLEAGALVLADRGLCCIDEFGSIRESDKTAIHEAMEQQTISVAKAGLVCKLNTRCSVLAATNPKGKYDPTRAVEINIALASPLLSRFDLVLILVDRENEEWDRAVSSFILGAESQISNLTRQDGGGNAILWPLEKLQAYIAYTKSNRFPHLTEGANEVLKRYYQAQRRADLRNAARTTIRLLESLIRLSQAHARLLDQREVTVRDAVVAVMLMEASFQSTALGGVDGIINALHDGFADDADEEYRRQESLILRKLGLEHLALDASGAGSSEAHQQHEEEDEEEDEDPVCSWAPTPPRTSSKRQSEQAKNEPEPAKRSKVQDGGTGREDGQDAIAEDANETNHLTEQQEHGKFTMATDTSRLGILLNTPTYGEFDEDGDTDLMMELELLEPGTASSIKSM